MPVFEDKNLNAEEAQGLRQHGAREVPRSATALVVPRTRTTARQGARTAHRRRPCRAVAPSAVRLSVPVVRMHDAEVFVYLGLALLPIVLYVLSRQSAAGGQPPSATGSRPLLGHALSYKGDPAAFLTKQCSAVGPCFSINLVGKKMVVVGQSREAVMQVACASESVLSAREAILDIGFDWTLGRLNVLVGTAAHAHPEASLRRRQAR